MLKLPNHLFLCTLKIDPLKSSPTTYIAHRDGTKPIIVKERNIKHCDQIQAQNISHELLFTSQLQHPNIIKLRSAFYRNISIFIAYDLYEHGDLHSLIKSRLSLPKKYLKHIMAQLVSALEYIHELKIFHTDIKLENLLINSEGHLTLTGFKFARHTLSKDNNHFQGTPEYAAPEIINKKPANKATDYWSLGVCIYTLLNHGHNPFQSNPFLQSPDFSEFKEPAKSLLKTLINKDPNIRTRINFRIHPFFDGVDWDHLNEGIAPDFELVTSRETARELCACVVEEQPIPPHQPTPPKPPNQKASQ